MKPDFLKITVILLLIETVLTLWLRGLLALPRFKSVAGCFLVCLLLSSPASAEGKSVTDLTTGIYLAYVETGDVDVDRTSYNGLEGLAKMIKRRTTIDIKGVRGVNLASDKLAWYPFIYWPMTQGQQRVSSRAVRNLQSYLTEGGMVVFDTRDQQFAGANTATIGTKMLRNVTNGLQIPELMQVGPGHILTKSFYLLDDFPGRFAGGKLWVEKMPSAGHDGVTSVIIGANDWAAAWSADSRDRARFDITPGGERQREIAYRFGVNLAMTALAGNYKSDQVHVPYILERMKK